MADKQERRVLVKGNVYRESNVVSDIVNWRYGALYGPCGPFVTFRQAPPGGASTSTEADAAPQPTKVWPLSGSCSLGTVSLREFTIKDRHTSTLWSIAAGRNKKAQLFSFKLRWPKSHILGRDDLTLGWEREEDANTWHAAFSGAVQAVRSARPEVAPGRTPRPSISVAEHSSDMGRGTGSLPAVTPRTPLDSAPTPHPLATPSPSPFSKASPAAFPPAKPGVTWQQPKRKWASFRHVNGVAVYQEAEGLEGQGGAIMVSAAVRSTPSAAFHALLDLGPDLPFVGSLQVEQGDAQSRTLLCTILPTGNLLRYVCAPRFSALAQTWREEDDGTHIVLLHSADHPAAHSPPLVPGFWLRPVPVTVVAAGFTIAPLQPRFTGGGASGECLVTLVLKVENLGGWLSAARLGALVQPWLRSILAEAAAGAVIALRDKVEQERFLVKPFALGQQSAALPAEALPDALPARRSSSAAGFMRRFSRPWGAAAPPTKEEEERGEGGVAPAAEPPPEGTLDHCFWSCHGDAGFRLRGKHYLQDRKKVPAGEPAFRLASVDLLELDAPTTHLARFLPSLTKSGAAFTFVLQLMVPGPPHRALVIAWAADSDPSTIAEAAAPDHGDASCAEDDSDSELAPFDLALARFLAGSGPSADRRRSSMFKLVPSVEQGSWIIRQSVGNTPVLLGKKLKTEYHRGPGNVFEVDVDVGSSRAANTVVGMVAPATKSLVISMGVALEGHSEEELPERLLGTESATVLAAVVPTPRHHAARTQRHPAASSRGDVFPGNRRLLCASYSEASTSILGGSSASS
ncbi:hypothetical protein WJX81_004188 [Elliptochloris bilobata]|uniref:Protein ENHANCED DISEASE RESISTANCE 2 C-terminal domain-containing protein n=1 Tax=Elliptochloris bilobata TaxID=381761 RepID=A0AAW1RQZ6_9CHLO